MTAAATSPTARFRDVESALAALRAHRLRVTAPRREIVEALFLADGAPLTADAIAQGAGRRDEPLDTASVYRNLEAFERAGIVRHVHLGHGPGLYALVGRGEREYLYCEHCGAATALMPRELDEVRALLEQRFGHEARFTHFPIAGICARCAAR